jgi:homoserine dehydrogenase
MFDSKLDCPLSRLAASFAPDMRQVNIGMIGGGTVGSGVFHALHHNGALMSSRIGVKIQLAKIAVKAFDEPRPYAIPTSLMTTDWQSVVHDPQVDVITELVGGTGLAKTMILAALKLGKPVITANKALLSAHGEELFAAAEQYGTNLYYEASVCGGIPIIKALREGFVGNRISELYGIVNGTCNYILSRMKLEGADFADVLKDAQAQGYAETEPSLDIDGFDAQHKIGILASLAHGFWVNPKHIYVEGIRHISRADIQLRNSLDIRSSSWGLSKAPRIHTRNRGPMPNLGRVRPKSLLRHRGASRYQFTRRWCRTGMCWPASTMCLTQFTYGATSWATLCSTVEGRAKTPRPAPCSATLPTPRSTLSLGLNTVFLRLFRTSLTGPVVPLDQVISRYFVRLDVVDVPGTLAKIATIFGEAHIGISSVIHPKATKGRVCR